MRHWLMKTEPETYSIDDLQRDGTTSWEGVRNYQVRNWMRDEMQVGDLVLIYHSNAEPPGVVGLARVTRGAYADPFQWDPKSKYYDEGAPKDPPRWLMVDVGFVERFARPVTLAELKADERLDGMEVTRKGSRLSVSPLTAAHYERVVAMGRARS